MCRLSHYLPYYVNVPIALSVSRICKSWPEKVSCTTILEFVDSLSRPSPTTSLLSLSHYLSLTSVWVEFVHHHLGMCGLSLSCFLSFLPHPSFHFHGHAELLWGRVALLRANTQEPRKLFVPQETRAVPEAGDRRRQVGPLSGAGLWVSQVTCHQEDAPVNFLW